MVNILSYADTVYTYTGSSLTYTIRRNNVSRDVVFRGTARKSPKEYGISINVGKIIRSYLKSELSDFRDIYNYTVQYQNNAYIEFILTGDIATYDSETGNWIITETQLETYKVLLGEDYGDTWDGGHKMMSKQINNHADSRMLGFLTVFNPVTSMTQTQIGYRGFNIELSGSTEHNYKAGTCVLTVVSCTNWDVVSGVAPYSWVTVSKLSDRLVLSFTENTGSTRTGNFYLSYPGPDFRPVYLSYPVTQGDCEYLRQYLTIESNTNGSFYVYGNDVSEKSVSCKKNGDEWVTTSVTNNTPLRIDTSSGDSVQFKCENGGIRFSSISGNYNAYGNIMSLMYGDNFIGKKDLNNIEGCFKSLFKGYPLRSVENLFLPATALTNNCYQGMFSGCSYINTAAPELPATVLADSCYDNMFYWCVGLTAAPELPATVLADSCYKYMFYGCQNLTTAPELLATALTNNCYEGMFGVCRRITAAPELPATVLADSCYENMFSGCYSLTMAPALPATVLADSCYYQMFISCTGLTSAPELPATVLADNCYREMFHGCTSLITAPELSATALTKNCYYGMFQGCTSLVTAPELPATTISTASTNGCYISMFDGCTRLNYIKCTASSIIYNTAKQLFNNWVRSVASTGTFVKKAGVTWPTATSSNNYSGIPDGWTVQEV